MAESQDEEITIRLPKHQAIRLLRTLDGVQDEGPGNGMGRKSDELERLIDALRTAAGQ